MLLQSAKSHPLGCKRVFDRGAKVFGAYAEHTDVGLLEELTDEAIDLIETCALQVRFEIEDDTWGGYEKIAGKQYSLQDATGWSLELDERIDRTTRPRMRTRIRGQAARAVA